MKIILVTGARPDFIKIAPLMNALKRPPAIDPVLVNTGQCADWRMCGLIFHQLAIPEPDVNLSVDGGSLASQFAAVMMRFESLILQQHPDCILVVGNVHHAIACVLIAAKMRIKVIHVEAGLRSIDRSMPEETNRILTDSLSDLLFCSEQSAIDNLRREGIPDNKICFVGNVIIDTLLRNRQRTEISKILPALELGNRPYAVITVHHRPNVEDSGALASIISAMKIIGRDMPVVFPMHPDTRKRISAAEMQQNHSNIKFIDPLGYLDFIKLLSSAKVVFTDSGGVQEETTILNVPCLTLQTNTDRPCTVEIGSNLVVGTEPDAIIEAYRHSQNGGRKVAKQTPPLWDGRAAERIAETIATVYG
jgi:UDP-N-acetylglucosamine 2-epimerase (non-hydrolysing)